MFVKTDTDTYCPWKGHAAYYTINVGGMLSAHINSGKTDKAS